MNPWVSNTAGLYTRDTLQNGDTGDDADSIHGSSEVHRIFCQVSFRRQSLSDSQEGPGMDSIVTEQSVCMSTEINLLASVVQWIKKLALNPGDPKKGQGPPGSEQNEAWVEKCVAMASKVRAVLWKGNEHLSYVHSSGNLDRQRIPPALYYKEFPKPNKQTLGKLRANFVRSVKYGYHCSGSGNHPYGCLKSFNDMVSMGYLLNNKASRKRIPIGTDFQAEVPPWASPTKHPFKPTKVKDVSPGNTCSFCESESTAWIGNLVWPHSEFEGVVRGRIGQGRPNECGCTNPTSIECVRSHVLVEREKLKLELGEAFNSLGFSDMGETVSEFWMKDEELEFELIMKMNPSSMGKNFWDVIPTALPAKSFKELVSYYFNVFVLRRRSVENRTVPESVDSDDDEKELLIGECKVSDGLMLPNRAFADSVVQDWKGIETTRVSRDFSLKVCSQGPQLRSANGPRHPQNSMH